MMEELRILNFLTDDKFLDTVINNHDEIEDNVRHYYVLVLKSSDNRETFKFKYIKNFERITLLYENEILEFIRSKKINSVILHSLYSIPPNIIPKIENEIPILWIAWGYDIYQIPIGKPLIKVDNIYLPITNKIFRKLLRKKRGTLKHLAASVRDFLININLYRTNQMCEVRNAIKRVNLFSGIIDLEYEMMKNNPDFKAEESVYAYSPLENKIFLKYPKGTNILLGNSGNMTNNHIDLLAILDKRDIRGNQIIAPMNYGGEEEYVSEVCKYGKKCFGNNFKPLLDFMDYDSYRELIGSCSSVIIGTIRQQAMGNIYLAITNGAKIFLLKNSILYKYFKGKGFIVFSIEDDLTKDFVSKPLSETESTYNYNRLKEIQSERWNSSSLLKIYEQFRSHIKNMNNYRGI